MATSRRLVGLVVVLAASARSEPVADLANELGSAAAASIRRVDPAPGYSFAWAIWGTDLVVGIEAATTGWVGLGLGERASGAMAGADIVTCTAEGDVVDGFAVDFSAPRRDVLQDWIVLASYGRDGNTSVVLKRQLDTDDVHEDRAILNTGFAQMLLFAWSPDNSDVVKYHGDNRYHRLVNLFGADPLTGNLTPPDGGAVELLNKDHLIVSDVPYEYFNQCHMAANGAAIFGEDRSIVAIEPVLDSATVRFIHHYTVYGFQDEQCNNGEPGGVMLYVWGPGGPSLIAPSTVGIQLGPRGLRSFRVQTHFNNPTMAAGQVDNSGIRAHFTAVGRTRPVEMGVMQLGDPFVILEDGPLPLGWSNASFECPSSTTSQFTSKIHVVAEALHMHGAGQMMSTEVIRNGQVVLTSAVDFFDFNFQGMLPLNPDVHVVQPGDTLRTNCSYHTTTAKRWGLSSDDEMCIDYIMYYPRQPVLDSQAGACGYNANGVQLQSIQPSMPADRHGFGDQRSLVAAPCPPEYHRPNTNSTRCVRGPSEQTTAPATSIGQSAKTSSGVMVAVALIVGMVVAAGLTLYAKKAKLACFGSRGPVYSTVGAEMSALDSAGDSDVDDDDDEMVDTGDLMA